MDSLLKRQMKFLSNGLNPIENLVSLSPCLKLRKKSLNYFRHLALQPLKKLASGFCYGITGIIYYFNCCKRYNVTLG